MRRRAAGVSAIGSLVMLCACSTSEREAADEPRITMTQRPSSASSPSTARPLVEIAVSVLDGAVLPPAGRVKVAPGRAIRLVVTSDVPTTVHVHGYQLEQTVGAGTRTTVEWVADREGLYKVEVHPSKLQLLQLEVR